MISNKSEEKALNGFRGCLELESVSYFLFFFFSLFLRSIEKNKLCLITQSRTLESGHVRAKEEQSQTGLEEGNTMEVATCLQVVIKKKKTLSMS